MVPKVVFVLGGPGSGKGTQCKRIAQEYGFTHLSAGDLLRAESHNPTSKYGKLIESHMLKGTIVPVKITCSLIEEAIIQANNDKFLIDGYPRNQDNIDGWESKFLDKVKILCVLFFDCPENVCIQRCLNRNALGDARIDDNENVIKKRFITHNKDTEPVVEYYKKQNLLQLIDSSKQEEDVFGEVKSILDKLVVDENIL